ncbi:transcriptional regulator [Halosimplex pelagicum]|uniref:Transcriptional regulator n=1 Tax=Halosimplex pelagicum TaxID=869886 RepID=A0A7D5TBD0_9EURY|nr:transcriptional regulator [Halosimplex pelagicum]QLH81195.1 transcriptional regulator [Halosimplex pelagicum]
MTKLKITVGNVDELADRTRGRLEAIESGADPEGLDEVQPELRFESYSELFDLLSAQRIELLEAIATHDPASIRAAAELVGRDYKTVHQQLSELAELGVIEWTDTEPGGAKKPQFPYDGLEIDLDLVDDERPDPATA